MTIPPRPAHEPVLLAEVLDGLAVERGGLFLDGTFGAGGYTAAILAARPENRVVAIDRDPDALASGAGLVAASGGRLRLVAGRFGDLADLVEPGSLAGLVLDIGVSSMQLDEPDRGFSFRQDGPLDMRMERAGPSAAELVNETDETELANLIYRYGEERRSRAIARAVVARRREAPFERTADFAAIVAGVVRAEPGLHPATRTFQALRIAVNDELGQLEAALAASERALAPGGRLAIVTFHSLEDRIVKRFLQERASRAPRASRHMPGLADATPLFTLRGTKPVTAGEAETRRNPRARSAKLRVAERTDARVEVAS